MFFFLNIVPQQVFLEQVSLQYGDVPHENVEIILSNVLKLFFVFFLMAKKNLVHSTKDCILCMLACV